MIAVVDYGLGNVRAFTNIYRRLGVAVTAATTPEQLYTADRIILPGVGAFDWALTRLDESGMRRALEECVIERKKPVLGVCVGMQMMARSSEEGRRAGLGWIGGVVRRFDTSSLPNGTQQLPHMGWNDVRTRGTPELFKELDEGSRFYFLHSYYFLPDHDKDVMSLTDYHGHFASAVSADNVYGVQFHPEKSHSWGIRLLQNFAAL